MTWTDTKDSRSNPASGSPRLYTVQETADLLRISTWTLHKLIREQQLGSVKIGARRLVPKEDVERFVAERRTGRVRGGFHE